MGWCCLHEEPTSGFIAHLWGGCTEFGISKKQLDMRFREGFSDTDVCSEIAVNWLSKPDLYTLDLISFLNLVSPSRYRYLGDRLG